MQILADVARRDGLLGLWSRRVIVPKCLYATLNRGLMYMVLSASKAGTALAMHSRGNLDRAQRVLPRIATR